MPKKKKSQDDVQPKQSGNAKSLKDLDKENEIIYNKKHIWMRRLFISLFSTYYVDYIITVNKRL